MRVRMIPVQNLHEIRNFRWVDETRRPYVRGSDAMVPVRQGFPADDDIPERRPYTGPNYHMIGDIAVIHGEHPGDQGLLDLIRWKKPRGIFHIEEYCGVKRVPKGTILYGDVGPVRHRENGCTFILDPSRVMFAMGNREEKRRIADMIRNSAEQERVADMFAGIGYFSIPAASSGAVVHAMELNPEAFGFLEQNIRLNGFEERVSAVQGDCRELLSGTYDRIIMGHFDSVRMLPFALRHCHDRTILHVHSIGSAREQICTMVEDAGFGHTVAERKVKKYAPGRWHIVQDVMLA